MSIIPFPIHLLPTLTVSFASWSTLIIHRFQSFRLFSLLKCICNLNINTSGTFSGHLWTYLKQPGCSWCLPFWFQTEVTQERSHREGKDSIFACWKPWLWGQWDGVWVQLSHLLVGWSQMNHLTLLNFSPFANKQTNKTPKFESGTWISMDEGCWHGRQPLYLQLTLTTHIVHELFSELTTRIFICTKIDIF